MAVAAPSPPEQGQLVSVRSRQWVVRDVRSSTLPPPALKPAFRGPQHLLALSSVEDDGLGEELRVIWEIEPGAKVIEKVALPEPAGFDPPDKLDASFQATLCACARKLPTPVVYLKAALGHKAVVKREIEDDSPRLFAFEEPPPELRAVRVKANEAAQAEKFVIPQNMRVPKSSVIRSLFEADGERDASDREDLGMWSDSKGKRLEGRAVTVEARKLADRVIAIVQPVEPVRQKPQRPKAKTLFEE